MISYLPNRNNSFTSLNDCRWTSGKCSLEMINLSSETVLSKRVLNWPDSVLVALLDAPHQLRYIPVRILRLQKRKSVVLHIILKNNNKSVNKATSPNCVIEMLISTPISRRVSVANRLPKISSCSKICCICELFNF
jgi:hypothetical protein